MTCDTSSLKFRSKIFNTASSEVCSLLKDVRRLHHFGVDLTKNKAHPSSAGQSLVLAKLGKDELRTSIFLELF